MRRFAFLLVIAILLLPGCAVNRARIFNYSNKAVDTTAAVTAGAMLLTFQAFWNGLWEDDDDFFDDASYRADKTSEQYVRYE